MYPPNLYYRQFFNRYDVDEMLRRGWAVEGQGGGLLLGNSHNEGGIPVLVEYEDGYRLMAEFEGYEYWVSDSATYQFSPQLININCYDRDITNECYFENLASLESVIDCRLNVSSPYKSKFLLHKAGSVQFIVNKYSTKKYIQLLDFMNKSVKFKAVGELLSWGKYSSYDPFAVPSDWQPKNRLPLSRFDVDFVQDLLSVPVNPNR